MNVEAFLSSHLNLRGTIEWTLLLTPVDSTEIIRAREFPPGGNMRHAQQRASRVLKDWGYKVSWNRQVGTLRPAK